MSKSIEMAVGKAIREKRPEVVSFLLEMGADPNYVDASDHYRKRFLHDVLEHDDVPDAFTICKSLIVGGADVNATENSGETPLHYAGYAQKPRLFAILLRDGKADVHRKNNRGWTPLHAAAMGGNISICRALVDAGAEINALGNDKESPFHIAAQYSYAELCKYFIGAGADPKLVDSAGRTALHYCAMEDNPSENMWDLLVKAGVDVDAAREDGNTALHMEAQHGADEESCRAMIAAGADIHAINKEGKKPIDLASLDETYVLFLEHGADPHAKPVGPDGSLSSSPFQNAVAQGCSEAVRRCLERGPIDVLQLTPEGESLSDLAERSGDPEVKAMIFSLTTEARVAHALGDATVRAAPAARQSAGMSPL